MVRARIWRIGAVVLSTLAVEVAAVASWYVYSHQEDDPVGKITVPRRAIESLTQEYLGVEQRLGKAQQQIEKLEELLEQQANTCNA